MKGTLHEGMMTSVLRELYRARRTGALVFRRGEERRTFRIQQGQVVNADSSVREDRMGELLVRDGTLQAADLKRAVGFMLRDKKRLGLVLEELGLMSREGVDAAVARHAQANFGKALAWPDGEYAFEDDPNPGPPDPRLDLTQKPLMAEFILQAVRSIADPDVVRYLLGDLDRPLALSSDPMRRFQKIALSPADGYLLSRVDGLLSGREVLQVLPTPFDESARSLLGLVSTGVLDFLDIPSRPRSAPPPAPAPEPARALPRPDPPRAAPPAPPRPEPRPAPPPARPDPPAPPPPPPPRPTEPAPALARPAPPPPPPPPAPPRPAPVAGKSKEEIEARRTEILEAHAGLRTRNHFEVLGLPLEASDAQVKEAYFRLARRFHPDTHADPAFADLGEKLEAVFIRLGEAYDVLKNPRTRGTYAADQASRQRFQQRAAQYAQANAPAPPPPAPSAPPAPAPPAAAEPPPAPPTVDPEAQQREAQENVRRGEKLLEQEKYWDAIQVLEKAAAVLEGKLRARARTGLARAYAKNPKWVRRAEEILQQAIADEPRWPEAHLALGMIYKEGGLKSRALACFRKVLDLKPEHEGAARELAELAPPPEPEEEAPPPQGGLFRKLFGKG